MFQNCWRRPWMLVALFALLGACSGGERPSGDPPADAANHDDTAANGSDAGSTTASGEDTGAEEADAAHDAAIGTGEVCGQDHADLPADAECRIVAQDCPQGDAVCKPALVPEGDAFELRVVCKPLEETETLEEGDACGAGAERCGPRLHCIGGTCKRWCELRTGAGCDPGRFCVRPDVEVPSGYGLCESDCPNP